MSVSIIVANIVNKLSIISQLEGNIMIYMDCMLIIILFMCLSIGLFGIINYIKITNYI